MTVLNGVIASSPVGASNSPALVTSLSDYAIEPAAQVDAGVHPAGLLIAQYPVSTTPVLLTGAVSGNFGNDFFDYFSFDPVRLDAGFINATSTFTVKLWNRNPYAVEITSITGIPEGVSLSLDVGDAFDRYQERTFAITVDRNGAAVLNGNIVFVFDDGRSAGLIITGFRARLWPYSPNWSDNYVANYAYKTESVLSRKGKEQRRALRHNARFYSEFGVLLSGGQLAQFDAMMGGWQNKSFVMPDYTEYTTLETATSLGDETLELIDTPTWLDEHVTIVIGSSVYLVTNLTGTTATVTPRLAAFPTGERVTLGRSGQIAPSSQVDLPTNTVGRFKVRFDAYPRSLPPPVPPAAALTFNGREVFLKKPNWSTTPQVTHDWPVEVIDYGRGRNVFFPVIDFCQRSIRATYTAKTPAEVLEIRNFFDRMRGMRGEFYAPTWNPDMELAAPVILGATEIVVTGSHAYDYLRDSAVHRCIAIVRTDGSLLLRETDGMSLVDGNTVVSVTEALPAITEVTMICWLHACALSSDILTVTWLTDTVAQVGLTWRTLEDIDV